MLYEEGMTSAKTRNALLVPQSTEHVAPTKTLNTKHVAPKKTQSTKHVTLTKTHSNRRKINKHCIKLWDDESQCGDM